LASCPKCFSGIEISSQFFGGLFTCPQCQAVYFIGFDGVPEADGENTTEPLPEIEISQELGYEPIIPIDPVIPLEPVETFQPMSAEQNLQDIMQYANTDMSSSPLTFQVTIEGLDLLQNVNELKEIFADSKLQMNFQELKQKISNGKLLIEKIQPAKAAILVQRLRMLDLKMHWEQKVYE